MEMAEGDPGLGRVSPVGDAPGKGNDGSGLVDKVKNVTKAGGAARSPKKR